MRAAEAELTKAYKPCDTLKAIGFTNAEARSFLTDIENTFNNQIDKGPSPASRVRLRYSEHWSELRHSRLNRFLFVAWGYSFVIWLYVIAMQLLYPGSVYWRLAIWMPIRLNYIGEVAFAFSFLAATTLTVWNRKAPLRPV